jgi:hypothetical protein
MTPKKIAVKKLLLVVLLFLCQAYILKAQEVSEEYAELSRTYKDKYKESKVVIKNAIEKFEFDKAKNDLGDKVVKINQESEYEYMNTKANLAINHYEFYNKFINVGKWKTERRNRTYFRPDYRANQFDRSVTGDEIFFDDSRLRIFQLRFSNIGEVVKLNFEKEYKDSKYLSRMFFNDEHPTIEKTIEFKVPDWLTVEFKEMNFAGHNIEKTETKKGSSTIVKFIIKDLDAYSTEYKRIGRSYSDPHILILIKTFESKGEQLNLLNDVKDVYGWNNRMYKMATNNKEKIKPIVDKIIQGKTNELDKIKAIYYWVQDNIRYIAYEDGYSGYIPAEAHEVLQKKYGDCKGMANLLTEMMTIAGFDARFSWIGTRAVPYKQNLPVLCVNNHAISTLYLNGKKYFLDGTENYVPLGENATRIQGKEVMVSNGDKFEIIAVPNTLAAANKKFTKANFTLAGDVIKGKVKIELTGEQRVNFHQYYQDLKSTNKDDFLKEFLTFSNENMETDKVKTSDLNNRELPVSIEGDVDLTNMVNSIGSNKFVGIDFFPRTLGRLMPDEKRVQGYDLSDVIMFEDEISLTVPADRKFVDVPKNVEIKNDKYDYKGEYFITGNTITLKKSLSIKDNIITKSELGSWKKFLEDIKEFNRYILTIAKK